MVIRVESPYTTRTGPSHTALRPQSDAIVPGAFGEGVARSLAGLQGATRALATMVNEQDEKRRRFDALRALKQFEVGQRLQLAETQRNWKAGMPPIYEAFGQSYRTAANAFIDSLDADLQDEFRYRASEVGAALALDTMQFQYEQNDTAFRQGIQDALDQARIEIGQDASRQNLERQRASLDDVIDATGLSAAEKESLRRKVYSGLEAVAYRGAQIERLRSEADGVGTDVEQAADLISEVSGVSPADAEAMADDAMQGAVEGIGIEVWQTLPKRVRASLISVAAQNGGELPDAVRTVAQQENLDLEQLAAAIRESGHETEGDLVTNPEAGIDNDPAYDNVAYEDRLALLADAEREVSQEIADEAAATAAQNKSFVNALHVALYDGTAGEADIEALRERGVLTDYDDIKKAYDILDARDTDLALRREGLAMLANGNVFAPGDEDHMKILNALIGKEGLAALESSDSEFVTNALIPLVRQAGIVPSDVRNMLAGMVRHQDPTKAYWALDVMQQIERANESAFLAFSENDREKLAVWQARKDYVSQDEMLKILRGPVDPGEAKARAALRKQGEELYTAEGGVMKTFDARTLFSAPGFLGLPTTPNPSMWRATNVQLNQDFREFFLDFYENTGDVELSKKLAGDMLKNVWGVTSVGNDNVLMKYPPEKVYPKVRDSYDWMERQLRRDGILAEGESFELVTDTQTENEVGTWEPPSYLIVKKSPNGEVVPIIGPKGLPARVAFDYGAEERDDENAWRKMTEQVTDREIEHRTLGQATRHALETGTPIPDEVWQIQSFGIGNPAAVIAAEDEDATP